MMEKSLKAINLIAMGWLLAIGLSGGCGSRTPSVKEDPPPAVSTKFDRLPGLLAGTYSWSCVSRPLSASPATGSPGRHKREQARLMADAFGRES